MPIVGRHTRKRPVPANWFTVHASFEGNTAHMKLTVGAEIHAIVHAIATGPIMIA